MTKANIIFALLNIKNTNILSGISILNIDVSEMSKEEALQKVNDIINEKLTSDITIKHGSHETVVNTSQFGIKFNIDKAVNKAYNIGKADNIVVNNYKILLTKLFKTNIEPELIIDEEVLQNIASQTGGKYFRATDNQKLRDIYKEIDSLEKTELEVKTYSQPREEFTLILMIAMLIFVVEQLLGLTILKNTF